VAIQYPAALCVIPVGIPKSISMKLRSHAAVVKSMKAYKKKKSGITAEQAVVKKIAEIKKSSGESAGREVRLALFRHLHA